MRQKSMTIRTALMAAAMMCLCSYASADIVVAAYEFNTPGDLEGWADGAGAMAGTLVIGNASTLESVLTSGASAAGNGNGTGLVAGTNSGNDPKLNQASTIVLATGGGTAWTNAVARVRQFDNTGAVVDYSNTGTILFSNPPVDNFGAGTFTGGTAATDDGWAVVTWDISVRAEDIVGFRYDPIGNSGVNSGFEVDYLRVSNNASPVPEPTSLALLGVAGIGFMIRRRRLA